MFFSLSLSQQLLQPTENCTDMQEMNVLKEFVTKVSATKLQAIKHQCAICSAIYARAHWLGKKTHAASFYIGFGRWYRIWCMIFFSHLTSSMSLDRDRNGICTELERHSIKTIALQTTQFFVCVWNRMILSQTCNVIRRQTKIKCLDDNVNLVSSLRICGKWWTIE